jgi:hypothetical protein
MRTRRQGRFLLFFLFSSLKSDQASIFIWTSQKKRNLGEGKGRARRRETERERSPCEILARTKALNSSIISGATSDLRTALYRFPSSLGGVGILTLRPQWRKERGVVKDESASESAESRSKLRRFFLFRGERKAETFLRSLSTFSSSPIFFSFLSHSLLASTPKTTNSPSSSPSLSPQVAARAEEAPVTTGKISGKKYSQKGGRWAAIDATNDLSDDQQDITRAAGMVDSLYQGWQGQGTQNAVMSSAEYLSNASRSMNNIEDGYYISPAFLDKLSIHVAKNFLDLPKIKVPLILGIWGGKGQGKTFQCALAYKKLGISPIVMSAVELESGNAGEPAKLIRQRYREASDIIKKGKMCSLFINDLDAGAGRMGGGTQYTVNNQMVNATLMNIADNPTNVQLPGVYKNEEIPRVPVVCTGEFLKEIFLPLFLEGC